MKGVLYIAIFCASMAVFSLFLPYFSVHLEYTNIGRPLRQGNEIPFALVQLLGHILILGLIGVKPNKLAASFAVVFSLLWIPYYLILLSKIGASQPYYYVKLEYGIFVSAGAAGLLSLFCVLHLIMTFRRRTTESPKVHTDVIDNF